RTRKRTETVESRTVRSDFWGMDGAIRRTLVLDDPALYADRSGMGAVVCAKLREDVRDMAFNGRFADRKLIGHQLVGISCVDEPQDSDLALAQLVVRSVLRQLGCDIRRYSLLPGMNRPYRLE